jgi:outer membrane protein TolC
MAEANAQLGAEKNKPTIDAFGTMGLNGRDTSSTTAVRESLGTNYPNYTVGVRLNMPLDVKTMSRNRQGYNKEKQAAEAGLKRTVFENERLWNDLTKRFDESQQRFKLARRIEEAQREKLDYERNRQRRGRSTTFQVIQFEGDYALSQLNRIRIQAEVLNIFAQLKTFGGGQ